MSERKWSKWVWAGLATVLLAATATVLWPYSVREFDGDATIEDHGFWSYPRYRISFPPISLTKEGTYEYHFSGPPPPKLNLTMAMVGSADYEVMEGLGTSVDVSLRETDGGTVTGFSAPLKDWVLSWTPSDESGEYYDDILLRFKLNRRRSYVLTIDVSDVDPMSPPIELQAKLEGGGNET